MMSGGAEIAKLVENLGLLATFVENAGEGFFAFDRNFRYLHWSRTMEKMSGFSAEEVLGQNAFTLFPFLVEIGEDRFFYEVLNGKPVSSQNRAYQIPETARQGYFDAFYSPLSGSSGEILGGVAIIRDQTAHRRMEERLQETESRFRRMADTAPVLLWMSGTDSLCNFFNESWLKYTGRTMEQELGVGWAEGVHPEDFQRCMDIYVAAFKRRTPFEMEYRLRRADGEFRWFLDRGVPRYTPGGEFTGYIGSCVDITDRKCVEEELRRAVDARDDFLSIASHELKTPITTLKLQIQMLQRGLGSGSEVSPAERVARATDISAKQIDKLSVLVQDLLDVSRMRAGKLTLDFHSLVLQDFVRELAERLNRPLAEARCAFTLDLPERAIVGQWDPVRLEQVLVNLLTNAMKYGKGKPIRLGISEQGENVFITVCDQGIGIEAAQIPLIFGRFARAVSEKHFGGLGLGLYITKQIVEAHGGEIEVNSKLGCGSEFTVILPKLPVGQLEPITRNVVSAASEVPKTGNPG